MKTERGTIADPRHVSLYLSRETVKRLKLHLAVTEGSNVSRFADEAIIEKLERDEAEQG